MGGGREGKGREGGRACKSCIYQPSIIILTSTDAPEGFVQAVALEEQKLNRRHRELYTFMCLKAFHSYENSYH